MGLLRIPAPAWRLLRPLAAKAENLKTPAYVVGGAVRDWSVGARTSDLDLVLEKNPAPLAAACARLLKTRPQAFDRFGTLRVIGYFRGVRWRVDFARSRRETYPGPASLPQVFPAPLREDLFRRDFTVNAMALRLDARGEGEPIDPYGGRKDLRARVLRPLHAESFRDDPTRVFRAARYLCRLGLKPAPGLLAMARLALREGHAGLLSRHRLAQELMRILEERDPSCPLKRLRVWGYLRLIHPRLRWDVRWIEGREERLGMLALGLGAAEGEKFLRSLPLERAMSGRLCEILKAAESRRSSRVELPPSSARALSHFFPGLPESALRPLWIGGEDLKALGLAPGKGYREILEAAARAQWEGKFASRREALAWLRQRAGSQAR